MAIALALMCALSYGVADYLGGRATRSAASPAVVAVGHTASLLLVGALLAVTSDSLPAARDVLWSMLAGAVGVCGLLLFYTAMSRGAMTVVSPVTSVVSLVIPVIAGILQGERPSASVYVGIVVAALAVVFVSAGALGAGTAVSGSTLMLAVMGGVGFGAMFVVLAEVDEDAGLWPLFVLRCVSIPVVLGIVGSRRVSLRLRPRTVLLIAAASGIMDMAASFFYLEASHLSALTIVSVVSSLYPVATVVLAMVVDREKVGRTQVVGMVLALIAVISISAGRA